MRLSVLNAGKSCLTLDRSVTLVFPQKYPRTRFTPLSVDSTPTFPSSLRRKEKSCVQVRSCPKTGKHPRLLVQTLPVPRACKLAETDMRRGWPEACGQGGDLTAGAGLTSSPERGRVTTKGLASCLSPFPGPGLPQQGRGNAFPSSARSWGDMALHSPRCLQALPR